MSAAATSGHRGTCITSARDNGHDPRQIARSAARLADLPLPRGGRAFPPKNRPADRTRSGRGATKEVILLAEVHPMTAPRTLAQRLSIVFLGFGLISVATLQVHATHKRDAAVSDLRRQLERVQDTLDATRVQLDATRIRLETQRRAAERQPSSRH